MIVCIIYVVWRASRILNKGFVKTNHCTCNIRCTLHYLSSEEDRVYVVSFHFRNNITNWLLPSSTTVEEACVELPVRTAPRIAVTGD